MNKNKVRSMFLSAMAATIIVVPSHAHAGKYDALVEMLTRATAGWSRANNAMSNNDQAVVDADKEEGSFSKARREQAAKEEQKEISNDDAEPIQYWDPDAPKDISTELPELLPLPPKMPQRKLGAVQKQDAPDEKFDESKYWVPDTPELSP